MNRIMCLGFGYTIVLSVLLISLPANCYVLTENQIKEDIKYLSQTSDGIKPSRLRALLLADLKRALPTVNNNYFLKLPITIKTRKRCELVL